MTWRRGWGWGWVFVAVWLMLGILLAWCEPRVRTVQEAPTITPTIAVVTVTPSIWEPTRAIAAITASPRPVAATSLPAVTEVPERLPAARTATETVVVPMETSTPTVAPAETRIPTQRGGAREAVSS